MKTYESLVDALADLKNRGYDLDFRKDPDVFTVMFLIFGFLRSNLMSMKYIGLRRTQIQMIIVWSMRFHPTLE